MSNTKTFSRWWIVVGALLIQLCLGAIYAWSVFRIPLQKLLSITPTQASLPFSVVLIFFALSTILGGRWQDKAGPSIVAIAGGVLLGLGMICASFATSLGTIILFYGVVSGIGIGLAYSCPIAAGVKWFPDKRGLITGLAVAGFGAGALIVGPLARKLIDTRGISGTFAILGLVFLIIVSIGALILRNPPAGYVPMGWTPPAKTVSSKADFSTREMLSTGQFYLIWLTYFFGCASGLMIIGQTSPIGQELAKYSKGTAALGVSLLAIFNTLGRIFWGKLSDTFGRTKTLFTIFLICGLAILSYNLIAVFPVWYWVGISLVGVCFGGYLALYPAINADFFGTKNVGINYGV
ncbi:MAG: OFA family MFS transporter, partial [Candidatus Stahlbacteria bacterium]|nr:OFA family MFS transporter [Candidatus Stahlbacteria bacterium]